MPCGIVEPHQLFGGIGLKLVVILVHLGSDKQNDGTGVINHLLIGAHLLSQIEAGDACGLLPSRWSA